MQSNTTALSANFVPSAFAAPRRAPAARTRTAIAGRVRHRLRLLGASLLLAAAPFAAEADQIIAFVPPAARAAASHEIVNGTATTMTAADVSLFNACPDHVRRAVAVVPGGSARAQAGRGVGQFAMASGDGQGGGTAEASVWMFVRDPQDRPTVKLNMTFKGVAASAAPDEEGSPVSAANFIVAIGNLRGTPRALVDADGCTTKNADSIFDWLDATYQVVGFDRHELDLYGELHHTSGLNFYTNGVLTASKPLSAEPVDLSLDMVPNGGGSVIVVRATGGGPGIAVIDPVITAHPDNPDVEIEIRAPEADPTQGPLEGFTAQDLIALGIDPQPFIKLGFLDGSATPPPPPPPPSGDTTPPATTASATPGANAAGWNNTPVTVTLSATDNTGGSGVKEVHYALSGATADSQVVPGASATVTISAEGTTALSYFAVDNAGKQEAAKTLTVRIDETAPSLTGLPAAGCTLWPPDHRLVQVASVTAADGGAGVAGLTLAATSNEPETGTGEGDIAPDVIVTGGVVQLRAERTGKGAGRVYTITARAIDQAGNVAAETATCVVPHDRGMH
jgi:hypothetical protein